MKKTQDERVKLTIKTKDGKPVFRLIPLGRENCLCYDLQVYKEEGRTNKEGWVPTGRYPSTIASGLMQIAQYVERNWDWTNPANERIRKYREETDMPTYLKEAAAQFKKVLEGLVIKKG